jgi:hypothetical protein
MPCTAILHRSVVASASFIRTACDVMHSPKLRILAGLIISLGFTFCAFFLLLDDALCIVWSGGLIHVNLLLR